MSLISSRPWSWKRSGSGHRGKWNSTCSGQWPFPKAWGAVWSQMWVTRKNRWAKIEPMACPTTGIYLYISMRTAAPPVEAPESEASQLQLMTPPPLTPWSILGFTMDFPPVNGWKVIFRELSKDWMNLGPRNTMIAAMARTTDHPRLKLQLVAHYNHAREERHGEFQTEVLDRQGRGQHLGCRQSLLGHVPQFISLYK